MLLSRTIAELANLMAPIAVVILAAGGMALIASSLRTRDDALALRVDMVRPKFKFGAPTPNGTAAPLGSLFRTSHRGIAQPELRTIARFLARFGLAPGRAAAYFFGVRLALTIALPLLMLLWAGQSARFGGALMLLAALVAALIGWMVPMVLVRRNLAQRTKEVNSGLPDALELLVVCVEAGLSLEDGLDRVVRELGHAQPALADELALTLADLKILPSRDQALANFAARINIPSVRSVIGTLSQTLRYGTPLTQSLRVVAAEMRNDFLVQLEEKANKLPAFMTLPVIVFLMPTIFIIMGGPAALRLLDTFHH